MAGTIFDHNLDKNPANYAPLSPLSFLERAAYVYPQRTSVIHGAERYTWGETYARCRRLASALARRGNDLVEVILPEPLAVGKAVELRFRYTGPSPRKVPRKK